MALGILYWKGYNLKSPSLLSGCKDETKEPTRTLRRGEAAETWIDCHNYSTVTTVSFPRKIKLTAGSETVVLKWIGDYKKKIVFFNSSWLFHKLRTFSFYPSASWRTNRTAVRFVIGSPVRVPLPSADVHTHRSWYWVHICEFSETEGSVCLWCKFQIRKKPSVLAIRDGPEARGRRGYTKEGLMFFCVTAT